MRHSLASSVSGTVALDVHLSIFFAGISGNYLIFGKEMLIVLKKDPRSGIRSIPSSGMKFETVAKLPKFIQYFINGNWSGDFRRHFFRFPADSIFLYSKASRQVCLNGKEWNFRCFKLYFTPTLPSRNITHSLTHRHTHRSTSYSLSHNMIYWQKTHNLKTNWNMI